MDDVAAIAKNGRVGTWIMPRQRDVLNFFKRVRVKETLSSAVQSIGFLDSMRGVACGISRALIGTLLSNLQGGTKRFRDEQNCASRLRIEAVHCAETSSAQVGRFEGHCKYGSKACV
jgi:hypothetical protein